MNFVAPFGRTGRLAWLHHSLLLMLALFALPAQAQLVVDTSADNQTGEVNATLNLPFNVTNNSTFQTHDIGWQIINDNTGGASLSIVSGTDNDPDGTAVLATLGSGTTIGTMLTLGPVPGTVQVQVCEATLVVIRGPKSTRLQPNAISCSTTPLHVFTATATATAGTYTLERVSADPLTANVGDSFPVQVQVTDLSGFGVNGMPVRFLADPGTVTPEDGTVLTDGNGFAITTLTAQLEGTHTNALSVSIDPDGSPATGDEVFIEYSFQFNAVGPAFVADAAADNQSNIPGATLPLALHVSNNGLDGTAYWQVSNDTTGGATLNLPGDLSGQPNDAVALIPASQTAGPTLTLGPNPGSVSVEVCEGQLQTMGYVCIAPVFFTFDATALPKSLTRVTADPVSAQVGSNFDVAVELTDGLGSAVTGATISFDSASGSVTPSSTTAVTDAGGVATASFTANQAGSFPTDMTVTYDPDGVPATGDELLLTYSFNFTAPVLPGTLIKPTDSGDGQTDTPGSTLPLPLKVQAVDGTGTPEAGITVVWNLLSGDAVLTATGSTTDAGGFASVPVQLGPNEGDSIIRAERTDVAGAAQDFTVHAVNDYDFVIFAGDNQSALPNTDGDNLKVRLLLNGSPVSGQHIAWQVISGDATVSPLPSQTSAGGVAETSIHFGSAQGAVTVEAKAVGLPVTPLAFHHTILPPAAEVLNLEVHAGDHQRGPITTRGDNPLVVKLSDSDLLPIEGRSIVWSLVSGELTLDAGNSSTDADGFAGMSFGHANVPSTAVVRARVMNSTVFVEFNIETYMPQLLMVSGDGQSGPVDTDLAEDFVIAIAPDVVPRAKSLHNVSIQWEVLSGGGSLSSTTTQTDSNGQARTRLHLGPNEGVNQVRAHIDGGPEVIFHATGVEDVPTQIRIVSGDGQALPTFSPSAPLVVEVLDANDQPLQGVALNWVGSNAIPGTAQSITGADGQSSNNAEVSVPGPASVRVSLQANPDIWISFSINGGVANILDLNEDQRQVAVAIDTLCPALLSMDTRSAAQQDLLERCGEMVINAGDHPDEVVNGLNEMMQDTALVQSHSGQLASSTQFKNVSLRMSTLRGGNAGPLSLDGLALANSSGVLPLALLPEAGSAEIGTDFSRWGFFVNGTIGRGKSDPGSSRPRYDYDTSGLTAGVDYRFNDHLFAGVAVGFNRQKDDIGEDDSHVDTRGYSLTGYSTWFSRSQWYVDGVFSWGRNDYDMRRRILYAIHNGSGGVTTVDQFASADTRGDQMYVSLALGRDFQKGGWNIGPYARASWSRLSFDAYDESMLDSALGHGLALSVAERDVDASQLVLGGRASRAFSRDWGVLMPNISIEWEHQLQDDPQQVVASFLADPTRTPFEINGAALDSGYFRVGVGLSALWTHGRSGFITYEHMTGASGLQQGTLSLGLRIEF